MLSAMRCCFFKQKTAYEITYGDWSSDVCSSDLLSGTSSSFVLLVRRKRTREIDMRRSRLCAEWDPKVYRSRRTPQDPLLTAQNVINLASACRYPTVGYHVGWEGWPNG